MKYLNKNVILPFVFLVNATILLIAQSNSLRLSFENNKIKSSFGDNAINRFFYLETTVPHTNEIVNAEVLVQNDSVIQTKKLVQYFDHSCTVINKVAKIKDGLQYDIIITGLDTNWSVPLETALHWDNPTQIQFWTTWPNNQLEPQNYNWQDPFLSAPMQNLNLFYGGETFWGNNSFTIPIASCFIKKHNVGLSFIQSLNDTILDLQMHTTANGMIAYQNTNHRIGKERSIHFTYFIILHDADWRAGMQWVTSKYRDYFSPKADNVNAIAGNGAYSSYEGTIDVKKYKKMAFAINWKASLDFPYMGMFIPPVKDDDEIWQKYKQAGVTVGDGLASINRLNNYSKKFRQNGFNTLSYFNVSEFGNNIQYPYIKTLSNEKDYWKNANDYLYNKLNNAILTSSKNNPDWDNRPIFSNWENCVAMDCGDTTYQNFLLHQAQLHIDKVPASAGICIDRLDWLKYYNVTADDGASFVDGNKTRSLLFSWKSIMQKLGPLMHENGKVIFCNPLYRRIDLMQQIDGIYDEFGNVPNSLNSCAQLAMFKPIIAWTIDTANFKPNPDAYFQHHLYLGSFITVPFPGNDHTIKPNAFIEKYYEDYGPLFTALKARKWLLLPNVLSIENEDAKANIFTVDDKIIIPIIHGKSDATIKLQLPYNLLNRKSISVQVLYPGESAWQFLPNIQYSKQLEIKVNLKRGCAILKLG